MLAVLRRGVRNWKTPIVGVIAEKTRDPFWVLVSCVLSLRTKDGTTAEATARLRKLARTPAAMLRLSESAIARAIYPVGFYKTKARHLRQICADLIGHFGGRVPDTIQALLTLKGVGRKTANLVVTVGYGKPGICVDTHVHRISNRWGYVRTKTPEETENALRAKLARRHWITYNDLLVTFGQNLCAPVSPHCSRCPLVSFCPKIGVEKSR